MYEIKKSKTKYILAKRRQLGNTSDFLYLFRQMRQNEMCYRALENEFDVFGELKIEYI